MGHIPYGYMIENGKATIDNAKAVQVRTLFKAYLSVLSLTDAAKQAGILRCHASIAKMLSDTRYARDIFYPSVIEESIFDKVQAKRQQRAELLGRIREPQEKKIFQELFFHALALKKLFDDPFKQAEYAYSLIEYEEEADNE